MKLPSLAMLAEVWVSMLYMGMIGAKLSHSDVSLTGDGSARVCSGHGTPLQVQAHSAAGGRVPGQGSGFANLEGIAAGRDVEWIGLVVSRGKDGHRGDSESGEETHYDDI